MKKQDTLQAVLSKQLLVCPYCKETFSIHIPIYKADDGYQYGSVFCRCDEYPILRSIIYLHKDSAKQILILLNKGDYRKAFLQALQRDNSIVKKPVSLIMQYLFYLIHKKPFSKLFEYIPYKYVWLAVLGRTHDDYNYYFRRNEFAASLQIFFPFGFINPNNQTVLFDVGNGIRNHYATIHTMFPHTTVISLDYSYTYLFLSKIFSSSTNVVMICGDVSTGPFTQKNTVDVVTYIDALDCISNQRLAINNVIGNNMLKKYGILYGSGLFEHMYFPPDGEARYPISRKLIASFMPYGTIRFYDQNKITEVLQKGIQDKKISWIATTSPVFRYCFLWSKNSLPDNWQIAIPKHIIDDAYKTTTNKAVIWKNYVY